MNRNYLIAGGAAIAIYFLFFRKKKDSVKPKKKQQGGGGGGGGFFPTGVPASENDETPDEGGTKVVSTGTGTQVIKGKSDVVIQGDRPSPYKGGMPDVTARPIRTNNTKPQVSGGDVVSTGTQTQVVKGKKSTTPTKAGAGTGIGTGGVVGANTGLGGGITTGKNKNVDPTRGRLDRQSGFLGIDAKFADFAGDVTPKFEFN